jgi:two-component system copper resistance phosphate regulon response regulator CusR
MKKILIVEDDDRLSESITRHLQKDGYIPECAYDGQSAVKLFASQPFDLVVLDINLPRKNGLDVCGELRGLNSQIPILMITAFGDIDSKMEAFDQGADDYLVKPFHLKELSAKVRVFLKRADQTPLLLDVFELSGLRIDPNRKAVARDGKEIHLTPKEYGLLEYLVKNKNRVVSKDELARNLWDHDYGVTPNTIEVYINFLRNKIDRDFSQKLLHTKPGFGYYISAEKK